MYTYICQFFLLRYLIICLKSHNTSSKLKTCAISKTETKDEETQKMNK